MFDIIFIVKRVFKLRLNNKGLAVSGIIYSILILFLILIFAILGILSSRKMILDKLKNDVLEQLNTATTVTQSPNLIKILMSQYNEGNTTGLVRDSTNSNIYYYTGSNDEVSNNYLWYGGHHWRVIEFDTSDNTLLLISQQPLTSIQPASSAWTTQSA